MKILSHLLLAFLDRLSEFEIKFAMGRDYLRRYQYTIPITTICFLLGILIAVQYKTIKRHQISTVTIQRVNQLTTEINSINEEKLQLERRVEESERKLYEYEQIILNEGKESTLISSELEKTRILAGLTSVRGRGIIVTLNDSVKTFDNNIDPNALLIHDEDILLVINELNAAGCEALSINGQRFVSSSAVRCVGPVVMVNNVKISSPFEITAIGEPDTMEAALRMTGGVIDNLAPWGIEVSIRKFAEVVVPKYSGPLEYSEVMKSIGE